MATKRKVKSRRKKPVKKLEGKNAKKAGRPSTLTRAKIDEIATIIRAGNYFETACDAAGVSPKTARSWISLGRLTKHKGTLFELFSATVKKANAEAQVLLLDAMGAMAEKENSWQALAWRIERRWPKQWGRRQAIEVSGGSKAIKIVGADDARALVMKALKIDSTTTGTT